MDKIVTKRLILRAATKADAAAIAAARSTPFVTRYNLYRPCDATRILRELESTAWTVLEERGSGVLVGAFSAKEDDLRYRVNSLEMQAWLTEPYAAKGYMTEALPPLMGALFAGGADRLSVKIFAPNVGAYRLVEKLGLSREGCLRQAVQAPTGEVFDVLLYSISREEYRDLYEK